MKEINLKDICDQAELITGKRNMYEADYNCKLTNMNCIYPIRYKDCLVKIVMGDEIEYK